MLAADSEVGRFESDILSTKGKIAVKWTKLSCRTFKNNQTRLQLFALAYNLAKLPASTCPVP